MEKSSLISAQVVLCSASKKSAGGNITAANIREFLPQPETASSVRKAFTAAGFETGAVVGNSFSITAPVDVFERTFGAQIRIERKRGIESVALESGSYELPLHALPRSLSENVEVVTFTPPPDFGPTTFGP